MAKHHSLHLSFVTAEQRSSLCAAGASDDLMSCVLSSVESSDLVKESLKAGGPLSASVMRR